MTPKRNNPGPQRVKYSHFNPRSPDGERPERLSPMIKDIIISIHAPRMGSDARPTVTGRQADRFQSTLPGWGATSPRTTIGRTKSNFNPRSPDGERPAAQQIVGKIPSVFQSTLPGWGATASEFNSAAPLLFQSTLPGWGATVIGVGADAGSTISIHAPRMGSDHEGSRTIRRPSHFNPRSPDGERPRKWTSSPTIWAKSSIFNTDCIADRH